MMKRTHKYQLTLQLLAPAGEEAIPEKKIALIVENHDEVLGIVERLQEKDPFHDRLQAAEFAIGLKLFSEIMIKNRHHSLFEELGPAFSDFMKQLKGL